MRISTVTAQHLRIPFRFVFGHSLKTRTETDAILLTIMSTDGVVGIGEILPRPYLTGETIDSVLHAELPTLAQSWLGREFGERDEVVAAIEEHLQRAPRALATFAGWELALLDVAGKTFGFAAGDVLGPKLKSELAPGVVIDFAVPTEQIAKRCMLLRLSGTQHLKIKVGHPSDVQRLSIVAEVLGAEFPLRLDANSKWSSDEAIASLRNLRNFNIKSIEQPVAADDLVGMQIVREQTGIPVMADESLCSFSDGERLIEMQAADAFNIRVGKCGGLLASRNLVKLANRHGLGCQLGTLVGETGILTRAGETLGLRSQCFEFIEGKNQNKSLLSQDIVEGSQQADDGAEHGLGLQLIDHAVNQWTVSKAINFSGKQGVNA